MWFGSGNVMGACSAGFSLKGCWLHPPARRDVCGPEKVKREMITLFNHAAFHTLPPSLNLF